jgi:2-dehydro-3-deoxyphosphogluconate aldolase/(4S)-4-hydroxy-2-oxoglutarate aldolase
MTAISAAAAARQLLARAPVIPVLTIPEWNHAVPLARALVAGGLPVLEVTLRTPTAMECLRAIAAEVEGAIVGAGTVLAPEQASEARKAGARFLVAPGATPRLLDAFATADLPCLPGAATASEAMALLERGYRCQKFFPAESSGGPGALKALQGPLPEIVFCPTGGITAANARSYLALPNVACVGASWPAPEAAVRAGRWGEIEAAARAAAGLARS